MPRCVKELNIRNYFSSELREEDVKIFGFDWDGSVGHNAWFVFDNIGDNCWFVSNYLGTGQFELIRPALVDDWTYISPWNSEGFFDYDFRGCNMYPYDFTGTKFTRCKFDTSLFFSKHTTLTDCEFIEDSRSGTGGGTIGRTAAANVEPYSEEEIKQMAYEARWDDIRSGD